MKKNVVIVLLSLVIVSLCGYLAYDKLNKTESKENKEENNKQKEENKEENNKQEEENIEGKDEQKEDNSSKEEGKEENNYKEYGILDNIELKDGSKWTVIQKSDKKKDYVIALAKEIYDNDIQGEVWEKLEDELYSHDKVNYDKSETKKYVDRIGETLEKKVKLKKVDGYKIRLLKLEDLFAIDDKFKYDSEGDSYHYYGNMDLSSFLGLTMDNTKCSEGKCTSFYDIGSTQCYEEQKDCKKEYFIAHWMLGVGGIRPVIYVYKSEIIH
jgi:hypothetical protein